jgi:adenylate cyclase
MSLFEELKRRNVVRVAAAYVVLGWVIAQVAEFAFENFGAPDWALKSLVIVLLLGLPLVVFFAWAFELTPEGVKREKDVDRSQSITHQTGRKLDRVIIGILLLAVAWFAWDKFVSDPVSDPSMQASADSPESLPEALAAQSEKSVAVLPFVAMSRGPDDEYFADGLTEEILNSLAQLPELLVTARTSAFSFKGQDIPVQEIAAALGVKHIVEGSVRRSGDRLRVTAQLIRAEDGFHLWSNNYDSESTDTIAVQENIAEQIASALNVVLDDEKREAMRLAGLRDVEAFTIYQKAVEVYQDAHGQNDIVPELRRANAMFEQVIERVPTFSQVYTDHSDLFIHMLTDDAEGYRGAGVTDGDIEGAYASAIRDYEAAVRYARSDEVRLMTELDLAYVSGNWRNLGRMLEQALAPSGCYRANWTPMIATAYGYSEKFLKNAYEILKCDPRRSLSWFDAARAALRAGHPDDALRLARDGVEIAPGTWLGTELVRSLVVKGLYDEARNAIDRYIADPDIALLFESLIAIKTGDRARFDQIKTEFPSPLDQNRLFTIILAAWSGDRDEANRVAALVDAHPFGSISLTNVTTWCGCGAPFDLDATPNYAARLKTSDLTWPPASTMTFADKDW